MIGVARRSAFQAVLACLIGVLASAAPAAPVTSGTAVKAARGWLSLDATPMQDAIPTTDWNVKTYADDTSTTLFHAIGIEGGGFVILAADDRIDPVIAFSPEGAYDDETNNPMRALLRNDLAGRLAIVEAVSSTSGRAAADAAQIDGAIDQAQTRWDELLEAAGKSGASLDSVSSVSDLRVDALIQSKWDQDTVSGSACYNYYTPYYDSSSDSITWTAGRAGNYYSGCIATTMAQLMRYWQYPVNGIGQVTRDVWVHKGDCYSDYVTVSRATRGGNGSGGAYSWSNMPLVPTSSATATQRAAIGALCYDSGVATYMEYASDCSGAYPLDQSLALIDIFDYDNSICGCSTSTALVPANYLKMIVPNLDAGYPVLLGISGDSGGHSIICDGYGFSSTTRYFHLNMGWSGYGNLWYQLPSISGTGYSFNAVASIGYNIFPATTGEIISGRVFSTDGSTVLSGAVVTAAYSGGTVSDTTDANGIYGLAGVPSSTSCTVSVSKTSYSFSSKTKTTGTSETSTWDEWGYTYYPSDTCGNTRDFNFTADALSSFINFVSDTPSGASYPITIGATVQPASDETPDTLDGVYFTAGFANEGDLAAGTFVVTLYLDGAECDSFDVASLGAGSSATVYNSTALGPLSAGSHTLQMVLDSGSAFTESDETDNSYTRTFSVTQALAELDVFPANDWNIECVHGQSQSFNKDTRVFTIVNSGEAALDWTVSKTADWLTLSTSGGSGLASGGSGEVILTLNTGAIDLEAGVHTDTIVFSNATSTQDDIEVGVSLTVSANATSKTFTIYNDGAGDLNVTSMALDDESAAACLSWSPEAPFTVEGGGEQTVTVTVDWDEVPYEGVDCNLVIVSNDDDEASSTVEIVVNGRNGVREWGMYQ